MNDMQRKTNDNIINLSGGETFFSISEHEITENCQYLKLKIGTMPFLIPFTQNEPSVLYVGCRPLYGKSYRGKMISSAKTFSDLLLDEFKIIVSSGLEHGVKDSVRISGAIPKEHIHTGLERLELLVSEIIQ